MNKVINSLAQLTANSDREKLFRLVAAIAIVTVLASGIGFYLIYSISDDKLVELRNINNNRKMVSSLIARQLSVENRKSEIFKILKEDENFKIKDYFTKIATRLHLHTKEEKVTTGQAQGGFSEVKLSVTLLDLNMKNLCELLQEIEKNPRVYTEKLDIEKAGSSGTLTANIYIATLKTDKEISEP